jgi:hypothetical protein
MPVSDDFLKEHLAKLFVDGFDADPAAFKKLNGWNMLIVALLQKFGLVSGVRHSALMAVTLLALRDVERVILRPL